MKKLLLACFVLAFSLAHAQQIRFNPELDKFCRHSIKEFSTISNERKIVLEDIAKQLYKKKYVVFTCQTNSRRTQLLQVWAQTSLYYFGFFNKFSLSIGDTITYVYPEVVNILNQSGFTYTKMDSTEANAYIISISKEYPESIILSKKKLGVIDTSKGTVVSICFDGEKSDIANKIVHANLPYQSPTKFEKTPLEKQKYEELNKQISVEMLYLAKKLKDMTIKNDNLFD